VQNHKTSAKRKRREKENGLGETVWFLDKANNITRGRGSGR